ncbi:MAG: hypothetical protein IT381_05835 [Deltaproteobacteria bacterium]|nr:hypothetical protein [Deltaproteobacteria bacterium]
MRPAVFAGHDCLILEDDAYEAIVSVSVGPRILSFKKKGGANVLAERSERDLHTALGRWRAHGGHRLWIAPEQMPLTYSPDNEPVILEPGGDRYVTLVRVDRDLLVDKAITVSLDEHGLRVEHRITNRGPAPRPIAAWALTILAPGGTVHVPQEPYAAHADDFRPARPLVLWRYSDLTDTRLSISRRFVSITPDPQIAAPNKLGFGNRRGFAAYQLGGEMFIKRFEDQPAATYPDCGSNTEVFVAGDFIELETLGPLELLAPQATTMHVEHWEIARATLDELK